MFEAIDCKMCLHSLDKENNDTIIEPDEIEDEEIEDGMEGEHQKEENEEVAPSDVQVFCKKVITKLFMIMHYVSRVIF